MSIHNYIDVSKRKDFSKRYSVKYIIEDLKNYKVSNIITDDYDSSYTIVAEVLHDDIVTRRANYKGYIEEGINLRMLAELRKSAVLPMAKSMYSFYSDHRFADTVDDVKKLRIDLFGKMKSDYKDEDWQYMAVAKYFLRKKGNYYRFDWEELYLDSSGRLCRDIEDYKKDFVRAHLQGLDVERLYF